MLELKPVISQSFALDQSYQGDISKPSLSPYSLEARANRFKERIENAPCFAFQDKLDLLFATYVKPYLPHSAEELKNGEPSHLLDKINLELDDKTAHKTYAVAIALLIPRVIRNVLGIVYALLYYAIKACVHPMEVFAEILVFMTKILNALKNPKFYSSAGAGLIGAAVGQGVISPQAIGGFIIGGALIVFGLLFGAIKAGEGHRWEAVKEQLEELPEMFLTGLLIGLLLGGLEKAQVAEGDSPVGQLLGLADDVVPLSNSTNAVHESILT